MRTLTEPRVTGAIVLLAVALLLGACDSGTSPVAPVTDASAALPDMLLASIHDEYHAEAIYEGVLEDFGVVLPFANIVDAETRHSLAIARLYQNRGWEVPVDPWSPENVPHFGSLSDACTAGVEGELANIAIYDELLAESGLPADVVQVFTSNRSASLDRHLPAFQRCSS